MSGPETPYKPLDFFLLQSVEKVYVWIQDWTGITRQMLYVGAFSVWLVLEVVDFMFMNVVLGLFVSAFFAVFVLRKMLKPSLEQTLADERQQPVANHNKISPLHCFLRGLVWSAFLITTLQHVDRKSIALPAGVFLLMCAYFASVDTWPRRRPTLVVRIESKA